MVVDGSLLSWHDWLFSPNGPGAGAGLLVGGTRGQSGCLQDLGKPRTGTPPLVGRVISQGSLMHMAAYWAFIFIICHALECQPGDILDYREGEDIASADNATGLSPETTDRTL